MLTALPQGREVVGMSKTHRDRPWGGEELGFVSRLQRTGKEEVEDGFLPAGNSGIGGKGKNGAMPTR